MVLFNHATREMTAKVVYYGPGLCGKTTNLMVIFDKLDAKQKGKMLSLATKTDRTLFFDLLPVDLGKVGAFSLKIQLYTVPGQVFYNETRKLVLKGADAVVFVADSQPAMVDATRESFANLLENLEENGIDANDIPVVVQYNKRDIPGVLPVEQLQEALSFEGYPYTEASALKGTGVMETFKLVTKLTAKHLMERMKRGTADAPPRKGDEKKAATKANTPTEPIRAMNPAPPPAPAAKAAPKASAKSAPTPPAPAPEIAENPFGGSFAAEPFPESAPLDAGYEGMEEVSLEQLLEGRERPVTMGGTVAVPIDDYQETPEQPDAGSLAGTGDAPDARVQTLREEIEHLEDRLQTLQNQRRGVIEAILRDLEALTERVRAELDV